MDNFKITALCFTKLEMARSILTPKSEVLQVLHTTIFSNSLRVKGTPLSRLQVESLTSCILAGAGSSVDVT